MKKLFVIFMAVALTAATVNGQAPQNIKYQTIVRDADGNIIVNTPVNITLKILQGSATGTVVCSESFNPTTNDFGLVNLEIGSVNPGAFSAIDWSDGPYYTKVELDGNLMGTSELLSVPYALYSERSSNSYWEKLGGSIFYNDGKVGIGTSTPMGKLSVMGDDSVRVIFSAAAGANSRTSGIMFRSTFGDAVPDFSPRNIALIKAHFDGGGWVSAALAFHVAGDNCMTDGDTDPCEKMRITSDGKVGIGTTVPWTKLDVRSDAVNQGAAIRVSNSDASHYLSIGAGNQINPDPFIYWQAGDTLQFSTNEGGWSEKMRITSDGMVGIGTSAPSHTLDIAGTANIIGYDEYALLEVDNLESNPVARGIYCKGTKIGIRGEVTTTHATEQRFGGYFQDLENNYAWIGGKYNGTVYKIYGSGSVSTITKNQQGNLVTWYAPESPDIYFTDYGEGQLENGKVYIHLDETYSMNIHVDNNFPIRVFVQLEDNCNGVYVTNKTKDGFDVIELGNGTSNAKFSYTVVGYRANEYDDKGNMISKNVDVRFQPALGPDVAGDNKD